MFLFQADKKTKRGQQNGFVNHMFLFQADKKTNVVNRMDLLTTCFHSGTYSLEAILKS